MKVGVHVDTYAELLVHIERLSLADQLRLLEDVAALLRVQLASGYYRSILELQGLGKDAWRGVDVQGYLDEERDSWSG